MRKISIGIILALLFVFSFSTVRAQEGQQPILEIKKEISPNEGPWIIKPGEPLNIKLTVTSNSADELAATAEINIHIRSLPKNLDNFKYDWTVKDQKYNSSNFFQILPEETFEMKVIFFSLEEEVIIESISLNINIFKATRA